MLARGDILGTGRDAVLREHVANLSQLLGIACSPPVELQIGSSTDSLWHRCEANLDALRIGGHKAIKVTQAVMEDGSEVACVVALLLAESENNQPKASEQAGVMLHNESTEIRQAARHGLRLASSQHIELHLRALLTKPTWDFGSAAALDILAFHRLPVQVEIGPPPIEEGDDIAWLLAEAGGRIGGAWKVTHLNQYVGHASARVRQAALRASARCRLPGLAEFCREATTRRTPAEAIEFLGVVGSADDLPRLQSAATAPAVAEAAITAVGRLGLPASVPFLLQFLASPELAEPAAFALWRITGLEVPRGPAPDPPPNLTEDELDFWEPQPPVDAPKVLDWWKANAARFDRSKRYQVGLNVSDNPLGPVYGQLPLAIRYDVYLRERALTPGTPDWELETWPKHQRNPKWSGV